MLHNIKKLLREGLMAEVSINDVSAKNFNIDEIIKHWLFSSPETPVHLFKYEMQDDYNLSNEEKESLMDADEDEILDSERFKKWIRYEAEYRIENALEEIGYKINGGVITIWREMVVDSKWIKSLAREGQRLGKYWSFEQGAAEAHWGGVGEHKIQIQTSVREEHIDWQETIEANTDLDIGEDEKEITLFKNTPLKIEALTIDGKDFDVSGLFNKVFKA